MNYALAAILILLWLTSLVITFFLGYAKGSLDEFKADLQARIGETTD